MNEQLKYLSPEWFRAEAPKYSDAETEKQNLRQQFCDEFSIEKLKALSGKNLLTKIFYSDNNENDSLCYHLESDPAYRTFGSIKGGSAYKFGLFYHNAKQSWHTGSPQNPQENSESKALEIGTTIRDQIVEGATILNKYKNATTIEEYEMISKDFKSANLLAYTWVMKYYHMIYPDIIPEFYSDDWQKHVLYALNIIPDNDPIVRAGQIALFIKECNISSNIFGRIFHKNVGGIRTFYRIGTGDFGEYWDTWKENGYVAIGWSEIGDLSKFYDGKSSYKKKELVAALIAEYNCGGGSATRTANQMIAFLNSTNNDTYVLAERGKKLLGIGVINSDYYFDETHEYKHCRNVQWNWINDSNIRLPNDDEGLQTTYHMIKDEDNLCFLYNIILHGNIPDNPPTLQSEYTKEQFLSEVYITESEFDRLSSLLKNKKNIILQGAPGVGKTFAAKRLAYALMGEKDDERIRMVQFHQSYSYEDFIEGYRPKEDGGLKLREGVFKQFCNKAANDKNRDYYFIIDEINRGNLSKIFGELLMLIETDKREDYFANLVYSGDKEKLSVPKNLYIIGMMNTADRSLAMIDYALRRRFAFYTMNPAFDNSTFKNDYNSVNCKLYHETIKAVKELNKEIVNDKSLGKGFEIGHSYFCSVKANEIDDTLVKNIIEFEIIPTIEEYWFDNDRKLKEESAKFENLLSNGEENETV